MRRLVTPLLLAGALALSAGTTPAAAQSGAQIIIVNTDGPNEGFNDPTPVAPVGGNPGVTLGEQRLRAFQHAADLWGAVIQSPVPIRIQASFDPLSCTATSGTLGAAGALEVWANTPGTEIGNIWYHVALANKLAGVDLSPAGDDLVAFFNSNLGQPNCLAGSGWYYGFDTNQGNRINLVTVLLHEFGHGLGFANFVNESAGTLLAGRGDIYAQYTVDQTTGKHWNQMTNAERQASAINVRRVSWAGVNTTADVPKVLSPGTPLFRVTNPSGLGVLAVGAAAFGPALSAPGLTADVVVGLDAANAGGPSTSDACSALTNASEVAGKIALVDRGTCGFTIKVKNAQDAGAVAVLVADNVAGGPPAGLGGADPTIVIPSVRITLADGNALKAALLNGIVTGTLGVDLAVRAGADPLGRALLNAPNPVQSGSSISHWDPVAFRNQLMEPSINADLTFSLTVPQDLTLSLFKDIGWFSDADGVADGVDQCLGSSREPTVVVGGNDSGVPNFVFTSGCRVSDFVQDCAASAANHGGFVTCVGDLGRALRSAGLITGAQYGALTSATARSNRTSP